MVGKTLGHYEILEPLGAGGMGEVYRARDTKLDRDVAIKVLPEDFSNDPDRLARFEREAKLLASLNHSNIAGIYGLEDEGEVRFIAMELVEGETLAERISRSGRIEVDEALDIARQIAEALEAAHENGVIHRDLKPANVVVTADGKAKVLDFGLAKAYETDGSSSDISPDLSHSPTMMGATRTGVIMGTAAYMSPEQAKGKPLDKRTDIWSFGALLYEMLAGRSAFLGEDVSETLAAILKDEPDWEAVSDLSSTGQALLRRCLRKNPNQRLHDIADARIEIDDVLAAESDGNHGLVSSPSGGATTGGWKSVSWLAVGLVVGGLAAGAALWVRAASVLSPNRPVHFDFELPDEVVMRQGYSPQIAMSPDGSRIVFEGLSASGGRQLYLLDLAASTEAQPLEGTRGARVPVFSPDGDDVAFVDSSLMLQRLSLDSGVLQDICTVPNLLAGAAWGADGTIVLGTPSGLLRVPVEGGDLSPLTARDEDSGESRHWWPSFTPDSRFVIFSAQTPNGFRPARLSIADQTYELIDGVERGRLARYLEGGYLVWADGDDLFAASFDPIAAVLTSEPTRILEGVHTWSESNLVYYAVSSAGDLVYAPGSATRELRRLVLYDEAGTPQLLNDEQAAFISPRFSPDGDSIAVVQGLPGGLGDIWVYDVATGIGRPITSSGNAGWLRWRLPDGEQITHSDGNTSIASTSVREDAASVTLLSDSTTILPAGWHPTEPTLLLERLDELGASDILAWTGGEPVSVLESSALEGFADLSPNGRWLAYTSNESGPLEVYVKPFPGQDRGSRISRGGGIDPRWSRDGSRIFYWQGGRATSTLDFHQGELVVVSLEVEPALEPSPLTTLFRADSPSYAGSYASHYDVSPVDDRIVVVEETERGGVTRLNVVLNWFEELKQRVPTGR